MPADTQSPLLGMTLQGTGNNDATWGDKINNEALLYLEDAIAGVYSLTTTGGGTTLTEANRRKSTIDVRGTLVSNAVLTLPAITSKAWWVYNGTSGAFTVSIKTATGTAAVVPAGLHMVYTDGANGMFVL